MDPPKVHQTIPGLLVLPAHRRSHHLTSQSSGVYVGPGGWWNQTGAAYFSTYQGVVLATDSEWTQNGAVVMALEEGTAKGAQRQPVAAGVRDTGAMLIRYIHDLLRCDGVRCFVDPKQAVQSICKLRGQRYVLRFLPSRPSWYLLWAWAWSQRFSGLVRRKCYLGTERKHHHDARG